MSEKTDAQAIIEENWAEELHAFHCGASAFEIAARRANRALKAMREVAEPGATGYSVPYGATEAECWTAFMACGGVIPYGD